MYDFDDNVTEFEKKITTIVAGALFASSLALAVSAHSTFTNKSEQAHDEPNNNAMLYMASIKSMTPPIWESWKNSANQVTALAVNCVEKQVPQGWDDATVKNGQIHASAGRVTLDTSRLNECLTQAFLDRAYDQPATTATEQLLQNVAIMTGIAGGLERLAVGAVKAGLHARQP